MKFIRSKSAQNLLLSLSVALLSSCDQSLSCDASQGDQTHQPPSTMTYPDLDLRLWNSVPMATQSPNPNFPTNGFVIDPQLPAGLSMSPGNGDISGTPTEITPRIVYTVSALQGAIVGATVNIAIEVFDAVPPGNLTYTPSSSSVPIGSSSLLMTAQFTGAAEQFAVVPALPSGLSIDPLDGTISGTAAGTVGVTQHTVTVSNPLGSTNADIQIELTDEARLNGLLVPSTGGGTLDVFAYRPSGLAPIDAENCAGETPLDAVATGDGKRIYVLSTPGKLWTLARDPLTGLCEPPLEVAQTPLAHKLAITPDGKYLIVALDQAVERFEIQQDGSLCCPVQAPGPDHPSTILAATSDRLLVGTSNPGEVWCYDIGPAFAPRGPALSFGAGVLVSKFVNTAGEFRAIAITNVYDIQSGLSGVIRDLRYSTDAELTAGATGVVATAVHNVGGSLSDADFEVQDDKLLVTDESRGMLYMFGVNPDGSLLASALVSKPIGGSPSGVLILPGHRGVWIFDRLRCEVAEYREIPLLTGPLSQIRTRSAPTGMVGLAGAYVFQQSDIAFVTSATDSTMVAVRSDPLTPGAIAFSAQGPVSTGAAPIDVAASQVAPFVYAADRDGGSISAFRFDSTTLQMTPIETELLPVAAQPISLAITQGGSRLCVLDALGRVLELSIDATDGSLTQTESGSIGGSMVGAVLRMDVLARYVFVVQPQEGRITTLALGLSGGGLLTTSVLDSLLDPVDLIPSLDGRTVSILERGVGRVSVYLIGEFSGDLSATGSTVAIGTSPLQLIPANAIRPEPQAGFEPMSVVDPIANLGRPVSRNLLTGALQAGTQFSVLLVNGTAALHCVGQPAAGDGFLGTSGVGPNARLTMYSLTGPFGDYVPSDSQPIGSGPHAIATAVRFLNAP